VNPGLLPDLELASHQPSKSDQTTSKQFERTGFWYRGKLARKIHTGIAAVYDVICNPEVK